MIWRSIHRSKASLKFGRIEPWVREDAWEEAVACLVAKAQGLERAGAELLVCGLTRCTAWPTRSRRAWKCSSSTSPTRRARRGSSLTSGGDRRVHLAGRRPCGGHDLLLPHGIHGGRRRQNRQADPRCVERPRLPAATLGLLARAARAGLVPADLGWSWTGRRR